MSHAPFLFLWFSLLKSSSIFLIHQGFVSPLAGNPSARQTTNHILNEDPKLKLPENKGIVEMIKPSGKQKGWSRIS